MNSESLTRDQFDALLCRLKKNKFDFEKSLLRYNPIEIFLKRVSRKEDAHSDMLAELLNPFGQHGQGDLFLRNFLRGCGLDKYCDLNNISWGEECVKREYGIYNSHNSRRRIDILVCGKFDDGRPFAVIIENKINGAPYLPNQIEDYRENIEKKFENGEVFVVCIHADCYNQHSESEIIITPQILGNIISESLEDCEGPTREVLSAYSTYLNNLGIMGKSVENAKALISLNLTKDDLRTIQALNAAYSALPQAYAELFMDYLRKLPNGLFHKYKKEYLKSYPGYCLIWNDESYRSKQRWQFMAVGFYHDRVKFYMVSNDWTDEESATKAKNLGFSEDFSRSCGWRWFKHNDQPNEIPYGDGDNGSLKPDFEKIAIQTKTYLDLLDQTEVALKDITSTN